MTRKCRIFIGTALVLALAGSATAAPWEMIIESRSGGQNTNKVFEHGAWANTSAGSTAPGCTPGIGARYFGSSGTVGDQWVEYVFTAPATAEYTVSATWGKSNGGETTSHVLMKADGTVVASQNFNTNDAVPLFNMWNHIAENIQLEAGVTYKVRVGETHTQSYNRVHIHGVKIYADLTCADNPVDLQVPLISGDTQVTVTGISQSPAASDVNVYANSGSGWSLIGTASSPTATQVVNVSALQAGDSIVATQVVNGVESCTDGTGTEVVVDDCGQVPIVSIGGVLLSGDNSVPVSGVISTATKVEIYVNGVLAGVNNSPTVPTTVVNLTSGTLAAGQSVTAKQFLRTLGPCNFSAANIVDDPAQIPAPAIKGLVDAGRNKVRVANIMTGATAVKVYAGGVLIGTNNSPTVGTTVVNVTPLVQGNTITARQFNRIDGPMSAGRRVTAAWIIEDFNGTVPYDWTSNGYLTGVERTWYQSVPTSYCEFGKLAAGTHSVFSQSDFFRIEDNGGPNGTSVRFEQIFPEDGIYHVQVQMLIEEPEGCMYNGVRAYQVGLKLNGEFPVGTPGITAPVGIYGGPLTDGRDGTSETEPYIVKVGNVEAQAGDSLYIVFSTNVDDCATNNHGPSAYVPPTPKPRMLIDNITLVPGVKPEDCNDVPNVVVDVAPLEPTTTDAEILVKSIDTRSTGLSVYANAGTPEEVLLNKTGAPINPSGFTEVTVQTIPLQAGWVISATQTLDLGDGYGTREGCKRNLGPVVGYGENTAMRVTLGIRETNDAGAIGSVGGISGQIEFVGASSLVSGAPQGKLLPTDPDWQTVTFDFSTDPIRSAMGMGDGAITATKGVLEHLAFTMTGPVLNSGRYRIFIDEIYNGETLLADFNDTGTFVAGQLAMFRLPRYSGTTNTLLLANPDVAGVVDTEDANGSGQSVGVEFQYNGVGEKYWLRLTTDKTGADTMPLRSPVIDLTQPITMKIKLYGPPACPPIFGDTDGDLDVDMDDFAKVQSCLNFAGSPTIPYAPDCGCLDYDFDGVIDSNDLAKFEKCATGAGVEGVEGCEELP